MKRASRRGSLAAGAVLLLAAAGVWLWTGMRPPPDGAGMGKSLRTAGPERGGKPGAAAGKDPADRHDPERARYMALERLKDDLRELERRRVMGRHQYEKDFPIDAVLRKALKIPEARTTRRMVIRTVVLTAPSGRETREILDLVDKAFEEPELAGAADRDELRRSVAEAFLNYPKARKHLGTAIAKDVTAGNKGTVSAYNFDEVIEKTDAEGGGPRLEPRYWPDESGEGMEGGTDPNEAVERYGYLFGLGGLGIVEVKRKAGE